MDELRITIPLCPRTKKNSQSIRKNPKTGQRFISTSDAYKAYRAGALMVIPASARQHIDFPVNVQGMFYMQTRRKVDIANLNSALHDILVDADVIADDNRDVVAATDGSRVLYDHEHPRTEVTITKMGGEYEQWAKK